ncbi:MAG: biotin/lipoyl-binding protein, partial [Candidatus Obscuribacterales bacterium]|nr:biotin/lipoyl-binding protein [Candidatus Obscuribacterales bacterium]
MNNVALASFDAAQLEKGDATKEAKLSLPKKNLGKKAIIIGSSIFLALTAVVAGTITWQYSSSHESTDDAFVDGDLTQISSRIPGTVAQVLVSDNQYVKAGQAILKLDPRDFQIKVDQAKAALEKAERQAAADNADISVTASNAGAQAITASSEISHASAAIDDAKSGVLTAKAELGLEIEKLISMQAQQHQYASDLLRYSNLVSLGAISQQQYDQSK